MESPEGRSMALIVEDRRTAPLGRILDLVVPAAAGSERKTIEARFARWTQQRIFEVVGETVRTGSGRHRFYPLCEVVLIAIAHALHEHGLRAAAIEPITAALRDGLTSRPGRNPIDHALDTIQDGGTKSAAAGVISFVRIADTDLWQPIDPDGGLSPANALDMAAQEVTITLNLRLALACLRPLLLEDKAPDGAEPRRPRAARTPVPEPTDPDIRPLRYRDLRTKMQAGQGG
jgi:hypothetical protein